MSAQSHFTINVAKDSGNKAFPGDRPLYRYLFHTDIPSQFDAEVAYAEILKKFPAPEYNVSLTHWRCVGHPIEFKP